MAITHHKDLIQGSDEWLAARCGLLTASEVKLILTPTLKVANNEKTRAHVWEIAAQRLTRYVEPAYISDDMLRGYEDEIRARDLYSSEYQPAGEAGFYTRDDWGFTLGYSPDGICGDDGLIEIKSRRQKFQVQTIADDEVPSEYMLQIQTGLLVSGRAWLDFVSYSGGLPMFVKRVLPDLEVQEAILSAALQFEAQVCDAMLRFSDHVEVNGFVPTERVIEEEMTI